MSKFEKLFNSVILSEEVLPTQKVDVHLSLNKSIVDKLEKLTGVSIKELLERDINDSSEWFLDLYEGDGDLDDMDEEDNNIE